MWKCASSPATAVSRRSSLQKLVKEVEPVAPIGQDRAGVIIDLDGMGGAQRTTVLDRQLRPRWMGDRDESAGLSRTLRKLLRAFARLGWGKIEWQPSRDDMPIFAGARSHGVDFRADQSGESLAAQLAGVGDRPVEPAEKMIGRLKEIIARPLIGLDDVARVQRAIREVRVGVKISAPETARRRERANPHISFQGVRVGGVGQANLTETCWFFVNSNRKIGLIKFVGKYGEERRLFRNSKITTFDGKTNSRYPERLLRSAGDRKRRNRSDRGRCYDGWVPRHGGDRSRCGNDLETLGMALCRRSIKG